MYNSKSSTGANDVWLFFFLSTIATGENSLEKLVLYVLIKAVKVKGNAIISNNATVYSITSQQNLIHLIGKLKI